MKKNDKLCAGLKTQMILGAIKDVLVTVDDATRLTLNVGSSLFGDRMFQGDYSIVTHNLWILKTFKVIHQFAEVNRKVTRSGGNRERRTFRI